MNKNKLIVIGGVIIIFAAGIAQFFSARTPVSPTIPTATSTPEQNISTTTVSVTPATEAKTTSRPAQHPLPLASGDIVASWDFRGAYADRPELIAKAEAEIARLLDLVGRGTHSDTILYVGIANQYGLMGDGKQEYDYLGLAIRADSNVTTGLPWHNLGVLMERLGAYETARVAYEKATLIQPGLKQWRYAYLEFLTSRMKDDTTVIEKAFTAAEKNIGRDAYLLQLRAEWETS